VLEGALEAYTGTAIVVSHDRYFLDRIVDRIVEVRDGELRSFEGGYTAWVEAKRPKPAPVPETPAAAAPSPRAQRPAPPPQRLATQKRF
jgi:ATPase subunit of ABC transporter with duplicated ATPase domains